MTLRMEVQNEPFDAYQTVNLALSLAGNFKLAISYSHPARLTWVMHAPQHTTPLHRLAFIRFWDDAETDENGSGQSADNPMFEGWIEEVTPGDESNLVHYVAYDPTRRAASEVTIMSTEWSPGNIESGTATPQPTEGIGAVPRLVYNVKIDNDADYPFERAHDYTVGEIIGDLLEDQYHPLYWCNAAPGDGTALGNGAAAQLNTSSGTGAGAELAGMDFKPQEKIVFESEPIGSGIQRLLQQYEPNYRLLWEPGTRKWRFYDLTQADQVTLTLNSFGGTYKVLSINLEPSLEGCYTAVKIYGPEVTLVAAPVEGDVDAFTTDGSAPSLAPVGTGIVLQTYVDANGNHDVVAYTSYQIVDPNKRRGAKSLSRTVTVPMEDWQFIPVKSPTLHVSFDGGDTWMTVLGTFFDFQNGIANMVNALFFWVDPPPIPASNQRFFAPNAVRLIWAYYTDPISVRKPDTGHEGTAYTQARLENIYRLYDESLAVGYEYGTPVTTATRLAQFAKLAQKLLDERKDIRWTGGCTIEGLKFQFLRLNKRINIAAVDPAGSAITTQWESINAWLTDVEYDLETRLTTLTWSSDQMEMLGLDVENLKERLKIKALQRQQTITILPIMRTRDQKWGSSSKITEVAGLYDVVHSRYVDPDTGEEG